MSLWAKGLDKFNSTVNVTMTVNVNVTVIFLKEAVQFVMLYSGRLASTPAGSRKCGDVRCWQGNNDEMLGERGLGLVVHFPSGSSYHM